MISEDVFSELNVRRINIISYLLIGLTFTIPILLAFAVRVIAFDMGQLIAQLAISLSIGITISWLILRTKSTRSKSYGRLFIGIVCFAWSVIVSNNTWQNIHRVDDAKKELIEAFMQAAISTSHPQSDPNPSDNLSSQSLKLISSTNATEQQIQFIKGAQHLVVKWANEMKKLEHKFSTIDLSEALKPENLTSASSITLSRQKISHLSKFISERQLALDQYIADFTKYFKEADIDEPNRREAIKSFETGISKSLVAYKDLEDVQLESLESINEMLNFAESQLGRSTLQNGNIQFKTQSDFNRYQSIINKIKISAIKEEKVNQRMVDLQNESRKSLVDEYTNN